MTAIGISMTPTPGGDETVGALIFFGLFVALFGWGLYFLPLIDLGVKCREGRLRECAGMTL